MAPSSGTPNPRSPNQAARPIRGVIARVSSAPSAAAPAAATSPGAKAAILEDREARAVVDEWRRLDLAIVGDIGLRFFVREGRVLLPREDVLLTIPLEQLRAVRYAVAVAGGPFRAQALAAALKGRFVNIVVTDEVAARQVLALD